MTRDEREARLNSIRDEGIARLDRVKAERGEHDPLFWRAMQFNIAQREAFEERHPIHAYTE